MRARLGLAAGVAVLAVAFASSAQDKKEPDKGEAWARFSVPGMT